MLKINKKIELTSNDIIYIYQYLKYNFNKVKKYRNITLLLWNNIERQSFFKFIESMDSWYLKKSKIPYINKNNKINKNIFSHDIYVILNMNITHLFLNFLSIKIQFNKIKTHINTTLKEFFIKNLIFIFVYFIISYIILKLLWEWIDELAWSWSLIKNLDMIKSITSNNLLIQLFFIIIALLVFLFKFLKHYVFYAFPFSKIYVLLEYKMFLYTLFMDKLIIKNKSKIEIWYIDIKKDFINYSSVIWKFLSTEELINYQIFITWSWKAFNLWNYLLSQAIVLDYHLIDEYQKKNVKLKVVMFNELKENIEDLIKELDMTFDTSFWKLKSFFNLFWLMLYFYVVILVLITVAPMIMGAM